MGKLSNPAKRFERGYGFSRDSFTCDGSSPIPTEPIN